jgi:DNA-directed RNA polymerase subunit L
MSQQRFIFKKQDHTAGAVLCDYLNRDPRVRAAGYTVRDGNLEVQIDADEPTVCIHDANQLIIAHIRSLSSQIRSHQR